MKKLALSLAVLFAVGMVSCGGNKDKECQDSVNVTEEVVALDVAGDSANGDSATTVDAAVATETAAPAENKEEAKADAKEEAKADAPATDAAAPEAAAPEAAK